MARPDGMGTVHLPGSVHAAWSDVSAGDLRPVGHGPRDGASLAAFATSVAAPTGASLDEVDWVTQVHGARVVEVSRAVAVTGTTGATTPVDPDHVPCRNLGAADALVADSGGIAVCVLTADCAPLALASPEGVFAAVHAGWRGLVAGVVDATVVRMRAAGATAVSGALGPCIHAGCYEFGATDLDAVAGAFGRTVRGTTARGTPALDMVAGVRAALDAAGASLVDGVDVCTACGGGQYSHRARGDAGRQALVVWSTAGMPS